MQDTKVAGMPRVAPRVSIIGLEMAVGARSVVSKVKPARWAGSAIPGHSMMVAVLAMALGAAAGCNSFMNSWFDPSAVGSFSAENTLDVRTSLSIQDTPGGIAGATDPTPEDLVPTYDEYRFEPGDTLSFRIFELLAAGTETAVQGTIDEIGTVSLPVLGQLRVSGMTRSEIEQELVAQLDARGVLRNAQVVVEPLVRRDRVYTIYGAIPQPNLYPLARPDTKLMDALVVAGGLVETVTEIFVVREEQAGPTEEQLAYLKGRKSPSRRGKGWNARGRDQATIASAFSLTGQEGGSNQSGEPDESELFEAVGSPDEPQPQSQGGAGRWMFVNNEWVRVGDEAIAAPGPGAEPQLPELPQATPQVDWDRLAGESESRVIRISPDGLRGGDPRQNIIIRPGDTIRLLAGLSGEYYMMGQVNRPGAYSITGRRITLKTAIASAGNLSPLAWPDRCTIYRRYGDREEMHQVNLDAIFAGKESDILLKNNDLILVGTHPAASFLAVFRNAFRMTYGFGFVYDRNFGDIDSYNGQVNPKTLRLSGSGQRFPNLFN